MAKRAYLKMKAIMNKVLLARKEVQRV